MRVHRGQLLLPIATHDSRSSEQVERNQSNHVVISRDSSISRRVSLSGVMSTCAPVLSLPIHHIKVRNPPAPSQPVQRWRQTALPSGESPPNDVGCRVRQGEFQHRGIAATRMHSFVTCYLNPLTRCQKRLYRDLGDLGAKSDTNAMTVRGKRKGMANIASNALNVDFASFRN